MNNIEREVKEGEIKKHKKNARLTLFIGVPLFLFAPFLFTGLSHFEGLNFTVTGQIGDTIGGITSPIVNLISAILIYLSFQQQLLANEIQISLINDEKEKAIGRTEKELAIFHYSEIKSSIESLKFESKNFKKNDGNIYYGYEALEIHVKEIDLLKDYSDSKFLISVSLILLDIQAYINGIEKAKHLNTAEMNFLGHRIYTLFFHKLLIPLSGINNLSNEYTSAVKVRTKLSFISELLEKYAGGY